MEKLKAILVDDELGGLESLSFEILEYCPELEIIASCQDPFIGLEKIRQLNPDLVFLDIEMPGLNGFELLKLLPQINFHVIFVTAYDQFAINAFDFNAIDYLLKPIRKIKLISAVQKVRELQFTSFNKIHLEAIIQNIKMQSTAGIEQIALPTLDGFKMVHVNDIIFLQAESNYTWMHHSDKKKYLVSRTLKDMEGMLLLNQYFRAHKSFLVNLNHVDRYIKGQGGYLVMKNMTQIPVARTQKTKLLHLLNLN